MPDCHDSITALAHVHATVALHRFVDPADWALGLAELAEMSDDEIALVASDEPDHSSLAPHAAERLDVDGLARFLLPAPGRQVAARRSRRATESPGMTG